MPVALRSSTNARTRRCRPGHNEVGSVAPGTAGNPSHTLRGSPHAQIETPGAEPTPGVGINAWQCPTFTWGDPTLSSAQSVFTSEFEMESGGSHSLWPPDKPVTGRGQRPLPRKLGSPTRRWLVELPTNPDLARIVRNRIGSRTETVWVLYGQASRSISTG